MSLPPHSKSHAPSPRILLGFSLLEVIVAVTIIAAVAAVGFVALNKYRINTEIAKLKSDVAGLNQAAQLFRVSGGSLNALTDHNDVLTRLKSVSGATESEYVVGFRGLMVDRRVTPVMMTASEQTSTRPRAIWVPSQTRFAIVTAGVGIKEFALGSVATAADVVRETSFEYARASDWVWDFSETSSATSSYSGAVSTSEQSPGSPTDQAGNTIPPSWTATGQQQLDPPVISLPTGFYEAAAYPLSITLTNPNPYDSSTIYYRFGTDSWRPYTGGALSCAIVYSTTLQAFAMALDPDYWLDSVAASDTYETLFISGEVFGEFVAPGGGTLNNNVQLLETTDEYSKFTWGRPQDMSDHTASYLKFAGEEFENIVPESDFVLGTFTFYNGGNHGTTGLDELGLALDLQLTVNIPLANEDLTVTFDVVSTSDHQWATDEENADYVQIITPEHEFTTTINNVTYYIVIGFGAVSGSSGFVEGDTLYVFEDALSEVNITGLLTANPPSSQQGG